MVLKPAWTLESPKEFLKSDTQVKPQILEMRSRLQYGLKQPHDSNVYPR